MKIKTIVGIISVLVCIAAVIAIMFKISNDYTFIFNKAGLTKIVGIDCSDSKIAEIKFKEEKYDDYCCTNMCVIMECDDFLNDDFVKDSLELYNEYSAEDWIIQSQYYLPELKTYFPDLNIKKEDIKSFGFNLKNDLQLTYLGLMACESTQKVCWFVVEEEERDVIYLLTTLNCKGVINFII